MKICLKYLSPIYQLNYKSFIKIRNSRKSNLMKIKDITQKSDSISLIFVISTISIKKVIVSQEMKQFLCCTINDGTALMLALFPLSKKNQINLNKTFKIQNAKAQDLDGNLYLTLGTNTQIKSTEDLKLMNKAPLLNISEVYQSGKQGQKKKNHRFVTNTKTLTQKLNQAEEQFIRYSSSRSKSRSISQSQQKGYQKSFDQVGQESQSQQQKCMNQSNQKERGQPKYKRIDLDLFNDFINQLYFKMQEKSLNFTRCRQNYPIADQFCNMPLKMQKKQIDQIIKYERKWGKDNNRPQDQIDYVIRVRIFQENFDQCREQMKQKLQRQKQYVERNHLIDKTGSYPQNGGHHINLKRKPEPRVFHQRKQIPPSRNRKRTQVKTRGVNNRRHQSDPRQQR